MLDLCLSRGARLVVFFLYFEKRSGSYNQNSDHHTPEFDSVKVSTLNSHS